MGSVIYLGVDMENKKLKKNAMKSNGEQLRMGQGTIANNKRVRKAMNEMLLDMDPEYFVTLIFNWDTNYEAARKTLKAWHAFVDKALLGGSWSRKAQNERTQFVAFAEHLESNMHWHLLLRLGDGADAARFEAVADQCWKKLVISGSVHLRHLDTDEKKACRANYGTKDLWQQRAIESFVLSREFKT